MEFRCSTCGHLGPAEEVRPGSEGVEVVCEDCGASEPVTAGSQQDSPDAAESDGQSGRVAPESMDSAEADETSESAGDGWEAALGDDNEGADASLVPEPGEGRRCPKCVNRVDEEAENCRHCGLNFAEARRYADGEAPWQQVPEEKREARRRAETLWGDVGEDAAEEAIQRFVEFVRSKQLYEYGIRRLRFYLVDHPEDAAAVEGLQTLATGMQSQLATVRARAEADAEEFREEVSRLKTIMGVAVAVLWGIALIVFVQVFTGRGC